MTGTDGMIPGARPYIRVVDSKKVEGNGIGHEALNDPTPAGKGWPAPIAADAMIGLVGDFVGLVAPASEADPNALLVQFLVSFGSAVGHRPYFTTESDKQTLNLFAVIIGETAGGRKGTGFGHVRTLISRADPTWQQSSGLASGEGIIHAVRDPVQSKDKKGDTVTVDEGVSDKRLALYEAEFASVLKVANREGNTLSTILRSAWETGGLQTLTRNSPAKATDAHISAVAHITRDELVRLLTTTEAASGFANRFLWALSRRSKILPEGGFLDETAMAQLAREVSALLIRARDIGELRRDDGARALWRREYSG